MSDSGGGSRAVALALDALRHGWAIRVTGEGGGAPGHRARDQRAPQIARVTAAAALDQGRVVFALPGDVDRESSVGCNRLIRDGAVPVLHGDGRQTRDFVHVDDTVDALVRAAHKASGLVVNIGTGVATSVRELWNVMAGSGAKRPTTGPRRTDDVSRCSLAPTRARIHLAWAPWTDLATGVRSLLVE